MGSATAFDETVVFPRYFEDLPDPRQPGKVTYPLDEILLLCLANVLHGRQSISCENSVFPAFIGGPSPRKGRGNRSPLQIDTIENGQETVGAGCSPSASSRPSSPSSFGVMFPSRRAGSPTKAVMTRLGSSFVISA